MPDRSDLDSTAPWIDPGSTEDTLPDEPDMEVIPDADSETVTFAWRRADDEATAAWITADAGLLVDGSNMQ
jgi:hypothetical protein